MLCFSGFELYSRWAPLKYTIFIHKLCTVDLLYARPMKTRHRLGLLETFFPTLIQLKNVYQFEI